MAVADATGNRPGHVELFDLTWTQINWERGSLLIIQGKSARSKEVVLAQAFLAEARKNGKTTKAAVHAGRYRGSCAEDYRIEISLAKMCFCLILPA